MCLHFNFKQSHFWSGEIYQRTHGIQRVKVQPRMQFCHPLYFCNFSYKTFCIWNNLHDAKLDAFWKAKYFYLTSLTIINMMTFIFQHTTDELSWQYFGWFKSLQIKWFTTKMNENMKLDILCPLALSWKSLIWLHIIHLLFTIYDLSLAFIVLSFRYVTLSTLRLIWPTLNHSKL